MMQWSNAAEFFAMGGYARFVWGAYGLTAALIALEVWAGVRRRRRALDEAREASAPAPGAPR